MVNSKDQTFDCEQAGDFSPRIKLGESGVSLNELMSSSGTIFQIDENNDGKDEEELSELWWTREESLRYIEQVKTNGDDFNFHLEPFEMLLPSMEKLVEEGVYKKNLRIGHGPTVAENATVLYHYSAYLDGADEPFDSSVLREKPFLHRLNSDAIVEGLYYALLSMRKGEKSYFIVRYNYAFKELGCPPRIPPKSDILYIIEILKIFEEGTLHHFELLTDEEKAKWSFDQVLEVVNAERISGNSYYQDKRYKDAATRYRKAISFLENHVYKDQREEERGNEVLSKLYPNIAMTYNKLFRHLAAMNNCRRALKIDPDNLKAIYHYGMAKFYNGNYEEAKDYLLRAKRLAPSNSSVMKALVELDAKIAQQNIEQKILYTSMGKMFN